MSIINEGVKNAAAVKKSFSEKISAIAQEELTKAKTYYETSVLPRIEEEGNNGWSDAKINNISNDEVDVKVLTQYLTSLGFKCDINCFENSIKICW